MAKTTDGLDRLVEKVGTAGEQMNDKYQDVGMLRIIVAFLV